MWQAYTQQIFGPMDWARKGREMVKSLVSQALETIGKRWDKSSLTRNGELQHTAAFARFCSKNYGLDRIGGLKPHMVETYVREMQSRGITDGTIANHLSAIRSLAHAVGKANIVARENSAYGIDRHRMNPVAMNHTKVAEIRAVLQDRALQGDRIGMTMHAAASMRDAFGLRAKESLMTCKMLDGRLLVEGAKGGRHRSIEVRTHEQRAAIELVRSTAEALGNSSGRIIPPELNLKQAMNIQRTNWERLGGTKANNAHMHASRHAYAQRRLAEGATPKQVAEELGHGRLDVLTHYS